MNVPASDILETRVNGYLVLIPMSFKHCQLVSGSKTLLEGT
ncbi:hypothetical protein GYH30_038661 [Glycine max]|nr:hypothetical protein GYH30_038661 [Glycine max]